MSAESWKKEFYPVDAITVSKENAIKHSLVKWYGLREENLKKHGLTEPPIYIDDHSCSLCHCYLGIIETQKCAKCPLFQYLGRPCASYTKGYEFEQYQDRGNPEPMIEALEAISFVEDVCK